MTDHTLKTATLDEVNASLKRIEALALALMFLDCCIHDASDVEPTQEIAAIIFEEAKSVRVHLAAAISRTASSPA